jgi:hypothetical protein
MVADPQDDAVWLPITGAASTLGVSVDTVRRRIRDGTFVSRKVPSRYGPAWQVRIERAAHEGAQRRDDARAPTGGLAVDELRQLVAQLQDRAVELAERVGYLQAQLDRMRALTSGRDGDF